MTKSNDETARKLAASIQDIVGQWHTGQIADKQRATKVEAVWVKAASTGVLDEVAMHIRNGGGGDMGSEFRGPALPPKSAGRALYLAQKSLSPAHKEGM